MKRIVKATNQEELNLKVREAFAVKGYSRRSSDTEFAMRLAKKHQRDRLMKPTRRDPCNKTSGGGGYRSLDGGLSGGAVDANRRRH